MLSGYFAINRDVPLPTFDAENTLSVNLMPKDKGLLVVDTDLPQYGFSIPSRDKNVLLFGPYNDSIQTIDSAIPSATTYAQKLEALNFGNEVSTIINITEHGSFAVMGSLCAWGLCEVATGTVYFLFSTDPNRVTEILKLNPLKYFVYRFPRAPIVFFQAQGVRAKWWRWISTHKCLLHAFNALEHKLYGISKA